MWRMTSLSQMVERDGGVYVEEEVIALSRDVPAGTRWMAGPIIRREARASIAASIEKTRTAVASRAQATMEARRSAAKPGGSGVKVSCGRGAAVDCLR